ncbi:MAG: DUF4198 domain-containing protein [Lacibacter sp.]
MRLKYRLTYLFVLLLAMHLPAHEFWLEPQQYLFSRTEEVNIRFRVGENFTGDNWMGNRQKVNELKLYYADVADDISDGLCDDEGDSLQFSIHEEGTVMVSFNNINSFIELDAAKFNAYLEEDGLQNAIDIRKQLNETDSAGREYYQRSVKTIVQVGAVKTAVYKKATNLPVDIIPLSHPYQLKNGDSITVQVLFKGQPLSNTKILTWHKLPTGVTTNHYMSNAKGEIRFPVTASGEWMVSCVRMIKLENDPKAQWQSYWGSLTWGYTGKNIAATASR